jgi:uncharacterized protein (TIGR02145 family)
MLLMLVSSCDKNDETPTTVIDIDGNIYHIVTIGTQVWMIENLKTTKYRNGDLIGTTTPSTLDISSESTPKYQWAYNGEESNVAAYGRLYTWYAAIDSRNVCPTGWHMPTDADWTTLTTYLGGESGAGAKLKETGTAHWQSPNTEATNVSGFTAVPGGFRSADGLIVFNSLGDYVYWWSSSELNADAAWIRFLYYTNSDAGRIGAGKGNGISVRCLKD